MVIKNLLFQKKLFAILDFLRLFNISCFKVDKQAKNSNNSASAIVKED